MQRRREVYRVDDDTYRVEIKADWAPTTCGTASRRASGARTAHEAGVPFRTAAVGC